MANYMAEVAKMLGVELGEEFEIDKLPTRRYKLTENNGLSGIYFGSWVVDEDSDKILKSLLLGECSIKRKPWKPKRGETYWYVEKDGDIWEREWLSCRYMSDHLNRYKLGNCYRTQEEAEANRDKWVVFYASDEVLEV